MRKGELLKRKGHLRPSPRRPVRVRGWPCAARTLGGRSSRLSCGCGGERGILAQLPFGAAKKAPAQVRAPSMATSRETARVGVHLHLFTRDFGNPVSSGTLEPEYSTCLEYGSRSKLWKWNHGQVQLLLLLLGVPGEGDGRKDALDVI